MSPKTLAALLALSTLAAVSIANAQPSRRDSVVQDPERRAELARRGGGIRVGTWNVKEIEDAPDIESSSTPYIEGFVRKGLDRHLVLENSVGFWRRTFTETVTTGGPLGGTSETTVGAYVVPQLTSLVFYPATGPEQRFEPYISGGLGLAIGIEDRDGDGGGSLVGSGGSGTSFIPGFGLGGGAGIEYRFSTALGIGAGARYQWIRFLNGELANEKTYQGFGATGTITYRFQF